VGSFVFQACDFGFEFGDAGGEFFEGE